MDNVHRRIRRSIPPPEAKGRGRGKGKGKGRGKVADPGEQQQRAGWGVAIFREPMDLEKPDFKLYGPVILERWDPLWLGATRHTNNTGELTAIAEACAWILEEEEGGGGGRRKRDGRRRGKDRKNGVHPRAAGRGGGCRSRGE